MPNKKRLLITLLVIFTLAYFPVPFALASSAFNFEFYNTSTNQTEKSLPFGTNYELIVASQTEDVRKFLPIEIKVRVGTKQYVNTIPNNPTDHCRGADGCSLPGPKIAEEMKDQPVEIWANSGGKQIAYFGQDVPPPQPSPPLTKTAPAPQNSPPTPASPSPEVPVATSAPTSTPTATSPDTGKIAGAGAIAAGLILVWWELTRKKAKNPPPPKPCPQLCKLGECLLTVAKVTTSTFGWTPQEEKDAFDGLDLTGYLRFSPDMGVGGIFGGGKIVREAIKQAREKLQEEFDAARKWSGVSLNVTYTWQKCQEVDCDAGQKGTDWGTVHAGETVLIPPGKFSHPLNPKGWDEKKLLDSKNQETIKMEIIRFLRHNGPKECTSCTVG